MIDLDKLEELAAKATPGPYFVNMDDAEDAPPHRNAGLSMVDTGRASDWPVARLIEGDQAKYIAATDPETILALIRAVRAARDFWDHSDEKGENCPYCIEMREALSAFTPEKNT